MRFYRGWHETRKPTRSLSSKITGISFLIHSTFPRLLPPRLASPRFYLPPSIFVSSPCGRVLLFISCMYVPSLSLLFPSLSYHAFFFTLPISSFHSFPITIHSSNFSFYFLLYYPLLPSLLVLHFLLPPRHCLYHILCVPSFILLPFHFHTIPYT